MLSQRRLRRAQACGWLLSLVLVFILVFKGWEPTGVTSEVLRSQVIPDAETSLMTATLSSTYAAPVDSAASPPKLQISNALSATPPCPPLSSESKGVEVQSTSLAPLRAWPLEAKLYSSDGRAYRRLSFEELWAWTPVKSTIVSGDSFRDRCPFVCDDNYLPGQHRGCRFTSSQLTNPARVFAKLPHHMTEARQILREGGVKHVYVNGGGDTPLTTAETSELNSNPSLLGFFSINVPKETSPDARILSIPLGVERTISPRGQYPGMYLNQRTGYNLASKLCWAPVMAAAVAAAGGTWEAPSSSSPLLYMNFRTETNEGVRGPAKSYFSGKSWVTDHVNAGDAVDLKLPGGGIMESPLELHLRKLWGAHPEITSAPWFTSVCGSSPVMPRGLDPALVPELSLPGYPLFLKAMASVPFILAPEGNGVSTHRAWEVMYVGSLAVVKEINPMADSQYRGLPVMMVRDWNEVTPTSLTCYALELFFKSWGKPLGGAGTPGGGLYPPPPDISTAGEGWVTDLAGITEALNALDPGGTLSTACAAAIATYAESHKLTHTGFLSLEAMDYDWWDSFISRHTDRLLKSKQ